MGLAKPVCCHPLLACGVLATAFGGWVVAEPPPGPPDPVTEAADPALAAWARATPRLTPEEQEHVRLGWRMLRVTVGMPREQVEQLLRRPPGWVGADGRARCTVILLRPLPGGHRCLGLCDVVLVFDPARPDQPFVRFECAPHRPAG